MIPEAAVEAAAERDYGPGWASASEWERSAYLAHATNLLEAAAPHMLADAWRAGCLQGLTTDFGWEAEALSANPYRPTP